MRADPPSFWHQFTLPMTAEHISKILQNKLHQPRYSTCLSHSMTQQTPFLLQARETVPTYKGLVAVCHSFCLFFIFSNIHTIIQSHSYSTFAEASLHLLIACKLSGKDLPVVPSRESNPGLPSSKPMR